MSPGVRFVSEAAGEIASAGARIEVVFTDLDGTLLGRNGNLFADGDGKPTDDTAVAIAALARAGVEIVLISGRRADHVAPLATAIGASGYVAEMGTLVVVEAKSGDHSHNEVLRPLGEYPFGSENPYDAMLRTGVVEMILERNRGQVEFHAPWHEGGETSHLLRGDIDIDKENVALGEAGHDWCEIVENGVIDHPYPGLEVDLVHAYHLVPKGTGKGRGVATWLRARSVSREAAGALGDGIADLSMAGEVGIFFMMRNGYEALGPASVDAANAYVTDLTYAAGWRGAIEALLANR